MIEVELQAQIGCPDFFDDSGGERRVVHEIAGHIPIVDRFDQQLHSRIGASRGGKAEVRHEGPADLRPIGRARNKAGHGVQPRARERAGVAQGERERVPEIGLAPRNAGDPAFARRPVAGRQVEENQGKAGFVQKRRCLFDGQLVGKLAFDGREACAGGGPEAIPEGVFGEHRGQVCRKPGHPRLRSLSDPSCQDQ